MNRDNIRIKTEALRDHGDASRIDDVWDRLEPKLTLGRSRPRPAGKWPLVAAALAAGFAMGIASSGWLGDDREPSAAAVPDAPGVTRTSEVFAAGATARTYPLPGGGTLTLEPGSIVDTISHDGKALTLRLVRGDATFDSPASNSSMELMVGSAHVAPAAGARMQVRREGDHAFVQVFQGSAEITSPNDDDELVAQRFGPESARRIRVNVTTARVPLNQRHTQNTTPLDDTSDTEDPDALDDVPAVTPAWVTACQAGDDERTLQLLNQEPDALAKVTDTAVLACIARAQDQPDAALTWNEKLMSSTDTLRAHQAARRALAIARKLHKNAQSDEERQKYAQKLEAYATQERQIALGAASKGIDLSSTVNAKGICRRIVAEASVAKPNWDAVASFAAQYKKAYPTGECLGTIHAILAKRPARSDPDGGTASDDSDADSPYDESSD